MGFEDIEKRMAKRGPSPLWVVFALVGLVLIGLNFVVNEVSREDADFGGHHRTTYWPLGIGIVCLFAGFIAKRFPHVAVRLAVVLFGLALIGFNVILNEWSRGYADSQGWYWVSYLPGGLGIMLLFTAAFHKRQAER